MGERKRQEWGSVTDQCPRYRAIGCWKEDLCDRMERLDPLMDGVEIDVEVPDTTGERNLGKKRNLAVNFSRKIYCTPYFNVDVFL